LSVRPLINISWDFGAAPLALCSLTLAYAILDALPGDRIQAKTRIAEVKCCIADVAVIAASATREADKPADRPESALTDPADRPVTMPASAAAGAANAGR
jgi:hypothetical protein